MAGSQKPQSRVSSTFAVVLARGVEVEVIVGMPAARIHEHVPVDSHRTLRFAHVLHVPLTDAEVSAAHAIIQAVGLRAHLPVPKPCIEGPVYVDTPG